VHEPELIKVVVAGVMPEHPEVWRVLEPECTVPARLRGPRSRRSRHGGLDRKRGAGRGAPGKQLATADRSRPVALRLTAPGFDLGVSI